MDTLRFAYQLAAAALLLLLFLPACQRPPQETSTTEGAIRQFAGPVHDLSPDEAAGGHTLSRHVGKTDADLRERLRHEPDISAASTYTDRTAAELAVGAALQQGRSRVERWLDRNSAHPNLVLDYRGDTAHPLGRTLHRGDSSSQPCSNAVVVLRWDGGRQYHVLTSYPECR